MLAGSMSPFSLTTISSRTSPSSCADWRETGKLGTELSGRRTGRRSTRHQANGGVVSTVGHDDWAARRDGSAIAARSADVTERTSRRSGTKRHRMPYRRVTPRGCHVILSLTGHRGVLYDAHHDHLRRPKPHVYASSHVSHVPRGA